MDILCEKDADNKRGNELKCADITYTSHWTFLKHYFVYLDFFFYFRNIFFFARASILYSWSKCILAHYIVLKFSLANIRYIFPCTAYILKLLLQNCINCYAYHIEFSQCWETTPQQNQRKFCAPCFGNGIIKTKRLGIKKE